MNILLKFKRFVLPAVGQLLVYHIETAKWMNIDNSMQQITVDYNSNKLSAKFYYSPLEELKDMIYNIELIVKIGLNKIS